MVQIVLNMPNLYVVYIVVLILKKCK